MLSRISCALSLVGLSIRACIDGAKISMLLCSALAVELACIAVAEFEIEAEIVMV